MHGVWGVSWFVELSYVLGRSTGGLERGSRADRGYAKGLGVEHVTPLLREFHRSTPQSDITVVELSGGHFPGKVFVRCGWLVRRQMRVRLTMPDFRLLPPDWLERTIYGCGQISRILTWGRLSLHTI